MGAFDLGPEGWVCQIEAKHPRQREWDCCNNLLTGLPIPVFSFILLKMYHYQTHCISFTYFICDNENSMNSSWYIVGTLEMFVGQMNEWMKQCYVRSSERAWSIWETMAWFRDHRPTSKSGFDTSLAVWPWTNDSNLVSVSVKWGQKFVPIGLL